MLLLDTHAFIFLASDQKQIPDSTLRLMADEPLAFSAISVLEIGLLVKRKKLLLPQSPESFVAKACEHHGIEEVPLNGNIALRSAFLPDIHNDPFDRIIIATALEKNTRIVSKDGRMASYSGVQLIWN